MTKSEWGAIYHFKPEDFDSPDKPGSGEAGMQYEFMRGLDKARDWLGAPFVINSGFRTKSHNAAVGGRKNSSHLRGWAGDIKLEPIMKALKVKAPAARRRLIEALEREGFTRFGLYPTFVHVDRDPSLPPEQMWLEGE